MSTIVNVRGACGAGKSTLVKTILEDCRYAERPPSVWHYAPGRRKPMGYEMPEHDLFVPGHYEIRNGGLDTIGDLRAAHAQIDRFASTGRNVLFEGMNQKDDLYEMSRLDAVYRLRIVFLDLSLEDCRDGFAGKGQSRKEDYVLKTWQKARREIQWFQENHFSVETCGSREGALELVRTLLGVQKWT